MTSTASGRLATHILIAMAAGALAGYAVHLLAETPAAAEQVASWLSILADVFLRLIKMIIAPLVFATLVSGVAHVQDGASLGRVGVRTLLWFIAAGFISVVLGILLAQAFEPGVGARLALPEAGASPVAGAAFDLKQFVTHLVPSSIFEAMAGNEILQIVVFSLFAGVALARLGERAAPLVRGVDALVELMLEITDYVMRAAPVGVFAAIAAVVATQGPGILATYGKFIASFYVAVLVLWGLLAGAAYVVLGRSVGILLRAIREPLLLGFATASSEAAYPKTLQQLTAIGVPKRIASFVLPLGYSFNPDGSMMYCAFALIFIAPVYGIELSFVQQLTMLPR
jgi:Na+/H+-dicarboxylate symporter